MHKNKTWVLPIAIALLIVVSSGIARAQGIPRYKVDPSWPKQLPNNWIMGIPTGIFIDKDDHIWVTHRVRNIAPDDLGAAANPPASECCTAAPSVIEFDTQGNVIKAWGGQGYVPDWPRGEHGIWIDKEKNVWIGGANLPPAGGRGGENPLLADRQVLKFSPEGKLLLEIGHPSNAPMNNQDTTMLGGPAELFVDDEAHEVYIADGYLNRRIVVYDSNTGAFKRGWGAYGIPLSEIDNGPRPDYNPSGAPPRQFGALGYPVRAGVVIGVDISEDGLVYVSDRGADRIQVFTKAGKFVKEFILHPKTLSQYGSVWSTMFSRDPKQTYLYVADGENGVIHVLSRDTGKEAGEIGHRGRQIGLLDGVEHMAWDSHGNLYTVEVPPNQRIQRFVPEKTVIVSRSAPTQAPGVPHYKVDATWPKVLPNNWMLANSTGLVVDKNDHIWVLNRPRQLSLDDAGAAVPPPLGPYGVCCFPAPTLLELDTQGNVLKSWGGPNYVPHWPILEHGLFIDKQGNFWIGGNFQGNGNNLNNPIPKPAELLADRHVLKFSPDGKQLLEIGHPSNAPMNNQDTSILGGPAEFFVDDAAREVYIADGYMNRRVVVYDSNTGAFKRGWGAYGMPLSEISNGRAPAHDPSAPDKQFRGSMVSVDISVDGLVYVGDRGGDRIQIFTKEGKFEKEFLIHPKTLGTGSVWSTAFSPDPKQTYLYVADGDNGMIRILNRQSGAEVTTIGHKGRFAGEFDSVEHMAFDSHGNLYVTEVNHNTRLQKFVLEK